MIAYSYTFYGAPCCAKMQHPRINISRFRLHNCVFVSTLEQADLLFVIGKISHKQAPLILHALERMAYPQSVIHLAGCSHMHTSYSSLSELSTLVSLKACITECHIDEENINRHLKDLEKTT